MECCHASTEFFFGGGAVSITTAYLLGRYSLHLLLLKSSMVHHTNSNSLFQAINQFREKRTSLREIYIGSKPPESGDWKTWAKATQDTAVPIIYTLQDVSKIGIILRMLNLHMSVISVTKSWQISPLWHKLKCLWQFREGLFSILAKIITDFDNFSW